MKPSLVQVCRLKMSSDNNNEYSDDIFQSIKSWFSNLVTPSNTKQPGSSKEVRINKSTVKDGILIFGGTGNAGKEIVNRLLLSGKSVVIASRKDVSEKESVLNQLTDGISDTSKTKLFSYNVILILI